MDTSSGCADRRGLEGATTGITAVHPRSSLAAGATTPGGTTVRSENDVSAVLRPVVVGGK
jgi:hypothetical protein